MWTQQKLRENKNKFPFYVLVWIMVNDKTKLLELQLTEFKFNHLHLYNIYRGREWPPKNLGKGRDGDDNKPSLPSLQLKDSNYREYFASVALFTFSG